MKGVDFWRRTLSLVVILSFLLSSSILPAEFKLELDLDRSFSRSLDREESSGSDESMGLYDCLLKSDFDRIPVSELDGGFYPGTSTGVLQDTVETYEIEIVEEKEGSRIKELAAFITVVAIVGYIVIVLMQPDEEEKEEDTGGSGKPTFFYGVSFYSISF